MTIRTVLVPLTGGESCRMAACAAARVVKAFGGHLFGLHVRSDATSSVPYVADGLTADLVQELVASAESEGGRRETRAEEIFKDVCSNLDIPLSDAVDADAKICAHWESRRGMAGEVISREARIMDLTVVPQPDVEADPVTAGLLDEVMTRSGRAVLMAPKDLPQHVADTIIIAWNGSTEAARAVADALPFLMKARNIHILTVGEITRGRPSGKALARNLACHGLEANVLVMEAGEDGVGESVLSKATELEATLIVFGAYSHSRWRELVLGGVTRTVIDKANIAVLMSH